MSKIYLGSHLNLSGPNYYLSVVQNAIDMNETTFMFYTGAPQNSFRKPTSTLKISEGRELLKQHPEINEDKLIIHAPYIINLGNTENENTRKFAIDFLANEIKRANEFHVSTIVLHPGSHVGKGAKIGINAVINGLNEILDKDTTNVKIALETLAGKGSEIGGTFEELKEIIDGVNKKERIGVCLDTCHINDAGYDVKDIDKVLNEFDKTIGLNKLFVIHLNDSLNEKFSHKDRHANIGLGTIGFDTLLKYVHDPRLENIPKILETPYINSKPPYKEEIKMLREKNYQQNWQNNF